MADCCHEVDTLIASESGGVGSEDGVFVTRLSCEKGNPICPGC